MDEDSCSPPEISSSQAIKGLCSDVIDLKKKRKLELEQLDLPSPKHKYRDRGCRTPILVSSKNKGPEIGSEDLPINEFDEKRDERSSYEESESQFESAKGSNSFAEDGDSAMSVHEENSFRPKYKKFGDRPSTSTAKPECAVSQGKRYHSDDLTVSCQVGDKGKSIVEMGEGSSQYIDDEFQLCETLEEHLLEFGYHVDCENDCSKQFADKKVEEFFGLRQDNFILSSARWNTSEETQSIPRKPTIDQEFEEYFSSLMM